MVEDLLSRSQTAQGAAFAIVSPHAGYGYAGEVMACNMMAEDAAEGIDAFIAKRKPVWKGR